MQPVTCLLQSFRPEVYRLSSRNIHTISLIVLGSDPGEQGNGLSRRTRFSRFQADPHHIKHQVPGKVARARQRSQYRLTYSGLEAYRTLIDLIS